MRKEDNVFYRARIEASKRDERLRSREFAAERLSLSVSTLMNYELGLTKIIPPDSVVMMADLYNAPELQCYYCASECPIGQSMPIPANSCDLVQTTVNVHEALCETFVAESKKQMLLIMKDGKLTEGNMTTVTSLLGYIDGLVKTLYELRLSYHKMLAEDGKRFW